MRRMKLNDYFEQVQVINLPDRTDRRSQMQTQLNCVNLQAKFFPAVRAVDAGDWPSAGAWGCFQSHFRVLEAASHAGARNVLVHEDDLDFVSQFPALEPEIVRQITAADWDLLYLGHLTETREPVRLELTESRGAKETVHVGRGIVASRSRKTKSPPMESANKLWPTRYGYGRGSRRPLVLATICIAPAEMGALARPSGCRGVAGVGL